MGKMDKRKEEEEEKKENWRGKGRENRKDGNVNDEEQVTKKARKGGRGEGIGNRRGKRRKKWKRCTLKE